MRPIATLILATYVGYKAVPRLVHCLYLLTIIAAYVLGRHS
jgi:hypothetical protein